MSEARRCAYVKEDGEGCGAYAMKGSAYCFMHDPDPEVVKQRRAARKKAGQVTSRRRLLDVREARQQRARTLEVPEPPTDYVSASAYLSWVVDQVAHGGLDETTGRVLIRGAREFLRSLDGRDLQHQLEKARDQLEKVRASLMDALDDLAEQGLLSRTRSGLQEWYRRHKEKESKS